VTATRDPVQRRPEMAAYEDACCRLRRQLLFALWLIRELKLERDKTRALAAADVASCRLLTDRRG
jgi:hypothetical protein